MQPNHVGHPALVRICMLMIFLKEVVKTKEVLDIQRFADPDGSGGGYFQHKSRMVFQAAVDFREALAWVLG